MYRILSELNCGSIVWISSASFIFFAFSKSFIQNFPKNKSSKFIHFQLFMLLLSDFTTFINHLA
jgi:hypothetical protein